MLDRHGFSKQGVESATGALLCGLGITVREVRIDPEPTRDGRYEHECEDCSTRYLCVLID